MQGGGRRGWEGSGGRDYRKQKAESRKQGVKGNRERLAASLAAVISVEREPVQTYENGVGVGARVRTCRESTWRAAVCWRVGGRHEVAVSRMSVIGPGRNFRGRPRAGGQRAGAGRILPKRFEMNTRGIAIIGFERETRQ